jgi:hypothetical protein
LSLGFGLQIAGSTDGTLPGQVGAGGLDLFSRNLDDSNEDVLWTEQSGTTGDDRILGGDGLVFDVGWIVGSTDGAFPGYENAGGEDVLLALVQPGDLAGRGPWPPPRPTTSATATPTPTSPSSVARRSTPS